MERTWGSCDSEMRGQQGQRRRMERGVTLAYHEFDRRQDRRRYQVSRKSQTTGFRPPFFSA
ncbi:hypothetical protein SBA3_1860006 [Candidatus Sulfopaludibacter sp. SbA3]|nr:hypothetical protein SBA3_1860006 [Candidatus Sulfopaludibacter sp. SbA3]